MLSASWWVLHCSFCMRLIFSATSPVPLVEMNLCWIALSGLFIHSVVMAMLCISILAFWNGNVSIITTWSDINFCRRAKKRKPLFFWFFDRVQSGWMEGRFVSWSCMFQYFRWPNMWWDHYMFFNVRFTLPKALHRYTATISPECLAQSDDFGK